jgi:signal transduction histidine kinase
MVSLVVLTRVLGEMIPGGHFAISNRTHNYVVGSKDPGTWNLHHDDAQNARAGKDLLYSEILLLKIPDVSGDWLLWAGLPNTDYWSREDVREIQHDMLAQFAIVFFAFGLVAMFIRSQQQRHRLIKENADKLSKYAGELEQSNADLQQFAYVASHDLKEPLRTVASYCQLLQRRYADKLDQDAKDFISFAVDGANRMQALINDLLKYSRVGTQRDPFRPVQCSDVLSKALENLKIAAGEAGATITLDVLPAVQGDEIQLIVLFQNLLANAVKFRRKDPVTVHIAAKDNGADWLFTVRDNGIGFDPVHAERIFVIFQRLHGRDEYQGTGMGLAICRRIVERHGGKIWADSEPGVGTTFYFTLPNSGPKEGLT